jgi:hypothetical protein
VRLSVWTKWPTDVHEFCWRPKRVIGHVCSVVSPGIGRRPGCPSWVRIARKVAFSALLLFHRKPNSSRSVPGTGRKFEAAVSDAWERLLRERWSGQQLLILTLLAEP